MMEKDDEGNESISVPVSDKTKQRARKILAQGKNVPNM